MSKKTWIITACLIVIAVIFIIIGISRAEHLEVLRKAVNICLECIGIG